jgi:hypothetical protein
MAFSPNPLNITYKKYDAVPASILVTFDNVYTTDLQFGIFGTETLPSWITISNLTVVDVDTVTALLTINDTNANTLNAGVYNVNVGVHSIVNPPDPGFGSLYFNGYLTLNFTLEDTQILTVTPPNIIFNHVPGATAPSSKLVQIVAENPWTITVNQGWVNLSTVSGNNNGNFSVSVNPTGLLIGTNTAIISVNDGSATSLVEVSLHISDGNTDTDYLYVSPTEIEFIQNTSSTTNPTKTIALNSSGNWALVNTANWLIISTLSGSSGSSVITLSLDITGLIAGVYASEITITSGQIIKKINVILHLNNTQLSVPDNGGLYFSDDTNEIILTSDNVNAILEVDFNAVVGAASYLYQKSAPYIKGTSTVNIGSETNRLLKATAPSDTITSKITTLIQPATIGFSAYEKDYFTGAVYSDINRNTLYFFNGKTPLITDKFTYLPSEITVSKNAIICLHAFKLVPLTSIEITGAITQTISTSDAANSNVYTAFINLSEYNLKPLQSITITFDTFSVLVRIKETPAESVHLAFENEWQLPEFIELTGGLERDGSSKYYTQQIQQKTNILEQIYRTEASETFSIYTGWLESQQEIDWLNKIFNSKQFWLYVQGEKIEVIPTVRNLNRYKTRDYQKNYKLTFRKAIV